MLVLPHSLTVGLILVLHVQLAQTEVAECNVTSVIEKNVLWLQITIDDVEAVQTLESTQKFCRVESRPVDVEALFFLQMVEQFSPIDKGKDKVKLLGRLEGELQGYDEWIIDLC